MLERVSSVECAAHITLRCLETPVRSYRKLDPSFWYHGRERIEVSPWWPDYLESIRSRSHVTSHLSGTIPQPPNTSITPRPRDPRLTTYPIRSLSNSSSYAQAVVAQRNSDLETECVAQDNSNLSNSRQEFFREERAKRDPLSKGEIQDRTTALDETEAQLDKAWVDFAQSGWSARDASRLIHRLAAGHRQIDLEHALRVFSFIPKDRRTGTEYETAVNICVRLNQYSAAVPIAKEAFSRKLGSDIFLKLLAVCVSKSLWNTAGDLWKAAKGLRKDPDFRTKVRKAGSKKRNFAGGYTYQFDMVADLPAKLSSLAARLKSNDPFLLSQKQELLSLCKSLTLTAVESHKVMSLITEEGILALFAIETDFGSDSKLHISSLATINHMAEKGTKAGLALLIYEDLRSRKPGSFLPKWTLRALIEITSAGRQSPQVYRSLLADYERIYGIPDREVYLQVLTACANQGEFADLYTVFQDFCVHNGPQSADDVNSLIRVHAVIGDFAKAQAQFDNVSSKYGFKPGIKNWNNLLLAYSRSNMPLKALDKFQEMQRSHMKPDEFSWSLVVGAAGKGGDTDLALVWIKKAREAGIRPTIGMMGALIDSYLLNDNPREAESLVVEAAETLQDTSQPSIRLWNSLFRYHAFRADSKAILRIQQKMKTYDIEADSMTYAALMTALVRQSRTADAVQILRTLHFSRNVIVTEFHYSILVHGFTMEKKYELASATYNEMLKRFPLGTPSAKLSMLYLQAHREEEKARAMYLSGHGHQEPDFRPILKSIVELTANIRPSDRASQTPNPGFGRRSSRSDIENVYFDSLISFLQRNKNYTASRKILEILEKEGASIAPESPGTAQSEVSMLRRQTQELEIAVESNDWKTTTSIWNQILQHAVRCYKPERSKLKPGAPNNASNAAPRNIQIIGSSESGLTSILKPFNNTSTTTSDQQVLPAYQYALSRPLSLYMLALDRQQKYSSLVEIPQSMHELGFKLSSKNWNRLIQALCKSSSTDDWVVAYDLFDQYLLPRAPSWEVVRRGKWVDPSEERPRHIWHQILKKRDKREDRKFLEKLDPGLLMPSYYTMVHLTAVWLKVSRLSSRGDRSARQLLQDRTPGTVKLVLETPYLRDRVQGILLRGRNVIGDPMARPRRSKNQMPFAGVQESQLLIDHLSSQDLSDVRKLVDADEPITKNRLPIAESLDPPVDQRSVVLPSKGRLETTSEQRNRINNAKLRRSRLLRRLVREMRETYQTTSAMIGTMTRGQPAIIPPSNTLQKNVTNQSNSQEPDGKFFQTLLPTSAGMNSENSDVLRRIMKLLRKSHRRSSNIPIQSKYFAARIQKGAVQTNVLAQKRFLRMIRLSDDRHPHVIAEPLQRLRARARARRRLQKQINANRSADAPDSNQSLPAYSAASRTHIRRLKHFAEAYTKQYRKLLAQEANSNFVGRRLAKRARWYKHNARRATGKLRSFRSRIAGKSSGNQR